MRYLLLIIVLLFSFSLQSQIYINNAKSDVQSIREAGIERLKLDNANHARMMDNIRRSKEKKAAAAAAKEEIWRIDNYEKVNIDLLKDNGDKYKYVLVKSLTGTEEKLNTINITKALKSSSIYGFVNRTGPKSRWTHKKIPEVINRSQNLVLYLSFHMEAQGPNNRLMKVTIEDYKDNTVYQADFKNKDFLSMLRPLLSPYITSKEQMNLKNKESRDEAIKILREAKELLNLGILTEEEYNEMVKKYKSIIIGG